MYNFSCILIFPQLGTHSSPVTVLHTIERKKGIFSYFGLFLLKVNQVKVTDCVYLVVKTTETNSLIMTFTYHSIACWGGSEHGTRLAGLLNTVEVLQRSPFSLCTQTEWNRDNFSHTFGVLFWCHNPILDTLPHEILYI